MDMVKSEIASKELYSLLQIHLLSLRDYENRAFFLIDTLDAGPYSMRWEINPVSITGVISFCIAISDEFYDFITNINWQGQQDLDFSLAIDACAILNRSDYAAGFKGRQNLFLPELFTPKGIANWWKLFEQLLSKLEAQLTV